MLTFTAGQVDSDMFVLALPLAARSDLFTIAAFIGGLSAATAMVIVELVALAIMVSNDILMPLVLQRRETLITGRDNVGGLLLTVRRMAICVILFLAYVYYRLAGDAQLASIGLLSFAAIAQLAPAFFGGLIWRRATARGAMAGMTVGILVWAYTLLLPSIVDAGIVGQSLLTHGPWGIAALRPQALIGLDLPPLAHGVIWSLSLNVLAYVVFSLGRAPASIERLQADLFVPSDLTPISPSFRLWRSSVTVEELTTTVARYLGEERTRTSFDSYALTRGISLDPKAEADFQLLRYAEHLLASAIGAASSRLVLSLLLRKRTVSTKAALKLLDDANAAIHYNREILQTALDHVRQGIAVFDKDLHLVCWNRQFGEILALPPQLTRVGTGLDHILRFNAERSTSDNDAVDVLVRERLARYVESSEPFLERFAERDLVMEVRANPMPDGGIVTTFTDITPSVKAAEELERANESLERRVQERTEELTRLNTELGRAKGEAEQANISKTRFLAAASHDILQPLNAARLYVTSLVERQGGGNDAQLVGNIDASLDAVEEIFGALLDISRLDTGAMKPEIVGFRIDELLRQLEVEFAPLAQEKGLRLDFVPCSLAVQSDRRLLRRLLQNLVSNAIKYTPKGRVLVGCRRHRGRLRHRRLRYRARHPAIEEARNLPGVPSPRPGRQGGPRPGARPFDRRAHRARARPQGRPHLDGRPRIALLGRGAALGRHSSERAPARRARGRPRAALRHHRPVHRQRPRHSRRHGNAARRLGLPRLQGAGPRVRSRGHHRSQGVAGRPAGRLPSRRGQRHRGDRRAAPALRLRPHRHPDHRRPEPAGARGCPRERHPGAQQAAQAGGPARPAHAMAGAAGRRGGVTAPDHGDGLLRCLQRQWFAVVAFAIGAHRCRPPGRRSGNTRLGLAHDSQVQCGQVRIPVSQRCRIAGLMLGRLQGRDLIGRLLMRFGKLSDLLPECRNLAKEVIDLFIRSFGWSRFAGISTPTAPPSAIARRRSASQSGHADDPHREQQTDQEPPPRLALLSADNSHGLVSELLVERIELRQLARIWI